MTACCDWAKRVIESGRLVWWENERAWVDKALPCRRSSGATDGAPYQWVTCWSCGRDLPMV